MSTKLGTLTLDLIAKIGNFTGPIKDAEKQTKFSFDNMRNHVNTYGMAVAGAAAGAVTALAAMAIETSNQAAELEIFAFRANTTTQEFQKMAVGAKAFGVEGDKLSDMMKDFNEKLGELTAIGAGGGVDFFEKIAMKTEGSSKAAKKLILDMQKLSGPEALQMYVDKLEEAGVTQQQMSFYLESMASDLTDLYPLLANGGEGLKLYGDMAERAGIIMTDQTIESAKALKDQVYMLDLQLQGAKNQLMQAVIPAFVDIAEAFLGGSEQGLQFDEVAEGVAKTLKGLASMAIGAVTAIQLTGKALGGLAAIGGAVSNEKDWYEIGPLGIAKAAYDARGEIAALTSELKTDMHETVMGAADRLDKMWAGGTSDRAKQLRGIRELNKSVGDTNGGLSELADKQNEAAKATSKHADELKRLREEQQREREQLSKAYSTDFENINANEKEDLQRILNANFLPADQKKFTDLAKMRFEGERAEYFKSLNLEFNQYAWSEEKKLEYAYQQDKEIAENDIRFSGVVKEAKLKFLDEQYAYQKRELEISQAKELLETKQLWMTAAEYAQQYYALVREEILNTSAYSPEMKSQKLDLLNLDTIRSGVGKNFSDPNDTESQFLHSVDYAPIQKSNTQWLDEEFQKQQEQMLANYENVKSLNADNHAVLLEAEREFLDAKQQLQDEYDFKAQDARKLDLEHQLSVYGQIASMTGATFGQMMDIVSQVKDENTKTYKTFFAINKAIAFAQAIINTEEGATKALAQGGIYGAALAMAVRVSGYASAGIIAGQAIAGPSGEGYADGGFTGYGGKYEHAGIVHKGEGVLTQEEIAALGGPAGFYALRESIKNGFADGGLVLDAPKVLNPSQNKDLTNYLSQAQSNNNQAANVNLNPNFVIVDERQSLGDYLYGPDGKKAFVKFFKQNRRELGFA